jgi:hypothetical protein
MMMVMIVTNIIIIIIIVVVVLSAILIIIVITTRGGSPYFTQERGSVIKRPGVGLPTGHGSEPSRVRGYHAVAAPSELPTVFPTLYPSKVGDARMAAGHEDVEGRGGGAKDRQRR